MKTSVKTYIGFLILGVLIISCKKNDPITELGTTNGQFAGQLTVTFNSTRPAIGDTLTVTASTWQRDDKFQKVDIYETIVETFGIDMTLKNGTNILTKTADEATLTIVDSILKKNVVMEVLAADLDKYWVTRTNNYVITKNYVVEMKTGKYANGATLIEGLSEGEFDVIKGLLSYVINKSDYLLLFPGAPASHFTTAGTYVLSATGMAYLKANLTKSTLISNIATIKKVGNYSLTVDVAAITPTNTTTVRTRTFDIAL